MSGQKKVQVYFDSDLLNNIDAEASKMGMNRSEFLRLAAEEKLSKNAASQGMDTILPMMRNVVQDEIKSQINRIAKMEAKTTKAAATSMYMILVLLHHFGMDPKSIFEASEKKAVMYLQTKEN